MDNNETKPTFNPLNETPKKNCSSRDLC